MEYGICPLSIVPIRSHADDTTGIISQLLYGEHFKILEKRKHWSRIRVAHDHQEGWIYNKQLVSIEENDYKSLDADKNLKIASDIVSHVCTENGTLIPVLLGSTISGSDLLNHSHEGAIVQGKSPKSTLAETALLYVNAPYLWGGKTPFGIDAPGLTQMVYKINGHRLNRSAEEQSKQGEPLSFIEESEPGDLAFFDDKEGIIDHVGIILEDNYIIHAHGRVRIDRLDHTGIFNVEQRTYSHQLRVIKKVI